MIYIYIMKYKMKYIYMYIGILMKSLAIPDRTRKDCDF